MTTVLQPQELRSSQTTVASRPRSLLSTGDLSLPDIAELLKAAAFLEQEDPLRAGTSAGEAPRCAAVLRVEHAHAHLVRAGGERPGRGHHAGQCALLQHREGRKPEGHRPHASRAGRGVHHSAPPQLRRAVPAGARDRTAGAERGRRHARASIAGAAGSAHDPASPESGADQRRHRREHARRHHRADHRRHSA